MFGKIKNAVCSVITAGVEMVKTAGRKVAAYVAPVGVAVGVALGSSTPASAAYDIVTESSGTISFAPGVLVTAIITGVIAAVAASAALVVISLGVRWLFRMLKGAK